MTAHPSQESVTVPVRKVPGPDWAQIWDGLPGGPHHASPFLQGALDGDLGKFRQLLLGEVGGAPHAAPG